MAGRTGGRTSHKTMGIRRTGLRIAKGGDGDGMDEGSANSREEQEVVAPRVERKKEDRQ